jgi:rRNA maturation protein Nop10
VTEQPDTLERLTIALHSGGNRDVVAALGLSQLGAHTVGAGLREALGGIFRRGDSQAEIGALGGRLIGLQADATRLGLENAVSSLASLIARLNRHKGWRLGDEKIRNVAESTLLMWLSPACPHCKGQTLAMQVCKKCGGSGKRRVPDRHHQEIKYTLNVLDQVVEVTVRAARERR